MRELTRRAGVFVLLAAFGLAGCASGGGGEGAAAASTEPGVTRITVDNTHPTSEDIQVFLQIDGGTARQLLGDLPRGETKTFTYDGDRGYYRLVAERAGGRTTSPRVSVMHNTSYLWMISGNRLQLSRR
jgi:hypothetical protein